LEKEITSFCRRIFPGSNSRSQGAPRDPFRF